MSEMKMNVCMVAYTFYEHDNRVRRYAEALAQEGHDVDVIALKGAGGDSFCRLSNVNVYKIQEREMNEKGKHSYLFRIVKFLFRSFIFLTKKQLARPYDVVHVHSVPDFEVFAALVPKLMGAKIILDIHDIVPEFFLSKFNYTKKSILYKALVFVENISCKFSNHVIISNHLWYDKIIRRSVPPNKCTVIMNYPDTKIFNPNMRSDKIENGKAVTLMYPGTLNWHQGLDIAIKAFAVIQEKVPYAKFIIYGRGATEQTLRKMVQDYKLEESVQIADPVPLEQIAKIMGDADIGVVPKRNDGFGGEAFSTKTLEFMILNVPIIVSKTKIDSYYFDNEVVTFFESGNVMDLAQKMLELIENRSLRMQKSEKAKRFMKNYIWDSNKQKYFSIIKNIMAS